MRARLAATATAEAWPWSSVQAHLKGEDDGLVTVRPVLKRVPPFADLIAVAADETGFAALRAAESTGRPLGNAGFIAGLERLLGRPIARRVPGRKPRGRDEVDLPGKSGERFPKNARSRRLSHDGRDKKAGGRQQKFTDAFKAEAVRLVMTSNRPLSAIARDLGIGLSTLGKWAAGSSRSAQNDA